MWAGALALAVPLVGVAQDADDAPPVKTLGVVTVTGPRPTSLPTQIPTTMESATREQIETRVNATDSEDALKYFPSLLVRKRYIGDYNHAILSSRASGTGNSARSAVYADGILLSNYLGNGVGAAVVPAALGPGDAGGDRAGRRHVRPVLGRLPGQLGRRGGRLRHPHADPAGGACRGRLRRRSRSSCTRRTRPSRLADQRLARQKAATWPGGSTLNRTDSDGQPLTFATAAGQRRHARQPPARRSAAPCPASTTPTSPGTSSATARSTTPAGPRQAQARLRPDADAARELRFGLWHNESAGDASSYLRDGNGNDRLQRPDQHRRPQLHAGRRRLRRDPRNLTHLMHGLSVKSHTQGRWDWEVAASRYDYQRDDKRQNAAANPRPGAESGGAGTLADGSGTGWTTLAAKGIWRPQGPR